MLLRQWKKPLYCGPPLLAACLRSVAQSGEGAGRWWARGRARQQAARVAAAARRGGGGASTQLVAQHAVPHAACACRAPRPASHARLDDVKRVVEDGADAGRHEAGGRRLRRRQHLAVALLQGKARFGGGSSGETLHRQMRANCAAARTKATLSVRPPAALRWSRNNCPPSARPSLLQARVGSTTGTTSAPPSRACRRRCRRTPTCPRRGTFGCCPAEWWWRWRRSTASSRLPLAPPSARCARGRGGAGGGGGGGATGPAA